MSDIDANSVKKMKVQVRVVSSEDRGNASAR